MCGLFCESVRACVCVRYSNGKEERGKAAPARGRRGECMCVKQTAVRARLFFDRCVRDGSAWMRAAPNMSPKSVFCRARCARRARALAGECCDSEVIGDWDAAAPWGATHGWIVSMCKGQCTGGRL